MKTLGSVFLTLAVAGVFASPSYAAEDLSTVVKRGNNVWLDRNISTGTAAVKVGKIAKTDVDSLTKLSLRTMQSEFKKADKEFNDDLVIDTDAHKFSSKEDLAFATNAVADGNAFDPENRFDRSAIKREIKMLVKALGNEASLVTVTTFAKIADDIDQSVYSIIFANKETKKSVEIFVIQGEM